MKRFAVFLGGLLVLPAFAEVAPVFYDEFDAAEYDDAVYDDAELIQGEGVSESTTQPTSAKISRQTPVNKTVANRTTSARVMPARTATNASGRASTSANAGRVVASRTASTATPRTGVSERGAISRSATRRTRTPLNYGMTRTTVARTGAGTVNNSVARSASNSNTVVSRAATNQINYLGNNGVSLYNANNTGSGSSLYTARVGVRGTSARAPVIRMASSGTTTTDTVSVSTTDEMDELVELTDYCKAQYATCMDNYCNVLDDNQGRCICSSNLNKYAKVEEALKNATAELQDLAQKIQYIGLSKNEVETLFTQTEAELSMQSKTDTTQLKTSLDKIKTMIINVQSGGATSSETGLSFDLSGLLDFSIDGNGFDLSSFLGGGNTSSVSNQRGEELYKTATARCKENVLKACTAQGVDASIITNTYDLEIDKQCTLYERNLNDSNDQMVATVRNAKGVLQKARLLVAQQKNAYDMRQCINQLDNCMQDDFVCGSDYENCLDPTGKYIVNGEIVVGSKPGNAANFANIADVNLYHTWDYTSSGTIYNAWGTGSGSTLSDYITATVVADAAQSSSTNMSEYLQNKIGYVQNNVNYGMCVSVLNKCQNYTYSGTGTSATYVPTNDVIKQYLARVLVQIKARQDAIIAEYAEDCATSVSSCLNQNNYPSTKPTPGSNASSPEKVALDACKATIVTCMSVNGFTDTNISDSGIKEWARSIQFDDYSSENVH